MQLHRDFIPVAHSVNGNNITGEAAEQLCKLVLSLPSMSNFGGIPIKLLRENTMTTLDLSGGRCKALRSPAALVLSALLPGATILAELKYAVSALRRPIDS